jgi:Rrf2 family nitric oxide-sensitive transcriptional repressor
MQLARKPQDIRIGKVVRDTEGAAMPAECFAVDGGDCAISRCCKLRKALAEAVSAFYSALDQYTLADIARNRAVLSKVLMIRAA